MAGQRKQYLYPANTINDVKAVIEPEFQPDLFDKQHLYVDLDEIRDRTYLNDLFFDLGYNPVKGSFNVISDYVKIIFSGHRGCGKSAELRRINNELNNPDRYLIVFIDLEKEVEVGSFQYADFFSLLIHKLIQRLEEKKIIAGSDRLRQLAKQLLPAKTEEVSTDKEKLASATELGAEGGFNLFGFLGLKTSFKETFSGENEISRAIRKEIKQNTLTLVYNLHAELIEAKMALEKCGQGKDMLFIIDGSEKVKSEVYEELFIANGNIISQLNINLLTAVPITAFFQIEKAPYKFLNRYTVPMLKVGGNNRAVELMIEIIAKRIDLFLFIEKDALNTCITFSGGCIRQLFQIVHTALKKSLGEKIQQNHVELAIKQLGMYLWEYLDNEHLKVLKEGQFRPAEKKVDELLYIYHQIGSVFARQEKSMEALQNYRQALEWYRKTNNKYEMGGTYYQRGSLHEAAEKYAAALDFYKKSLENLLQFDHPNLSMAQRALARIQEKIHDQQSPRPSASYR